jgi:hypothetical protein
MCDGGTLIAATENPERPSHADALDSVTVRSVLSERQAFPEDKPSKAKSAVFPIA